MNNTVIEARSFMILVAFFTVGTSILIAPSGLAHDAKQDAWLASLIGIAMDVLLVWLYITLAERYPDRSIVEYCELALGKWIGKALALAFICFCFLLASLLIGDMGFFLTSQIMTDTPIEASELLFAAAVIFTVRAGLATYAMAAELFYAGMIVLFLTIFLPSVPEFQAAHVLPALERGIMPSVKGGFTFMTLQELVIMLMFYPHVVKGTGRKRSFLAGALIGSAILQLTTTAIILVIGAPVTGNQLFPAYYIAKHISIGEFFQRLEVGMMLLWVLSIFMKLTLTFHASVKGMAQLLRLRDERPFLWPLAAVMIALSLACYPNIIYAREMIARTWAPLSILFMVALPLLLLAGSFVRGRRTRV
ncbi:MAG: endospore germination permease [Paenibacillaceae bacterium]|nr:endospore germination permease [Paenibacillaceae bacterium]